MRRQPVHHCQWGGRRLGLEVNRPAGLQQFQTPRWLRRLPSLGRLVLGTWTDKFMLNLHQSVSGTTTTTMFRKLLTCSTYNILADNPPRVPTHHLYV